MLPQLRRLEEMYPDDLVVIGVHAPKFPAERDAANVRAAVLQFGVTHPVVSDPDHAIWDAYAVRAWPTLMFIDPQGRVIGAHAAELHFPQLGEAVGAMLYKLRGDGLLDHDDLPLPLQPEARPSGPLAFPDTALPYEAGDRIVVSDTGHHRILVMSRGGRVERAFGRGAPGFSNGNGQAAFNAPRGLAIAGDNLYVADTENHAVRRIDLASMQVSTIAGTGTQAASFNRGGPARETALSSPWDLALSADARTLYVAIAGFHQVWALDLASAMIGPFSGTGHEGIKDEARGRAWHAQPSGLALADGILYVADSETSAVRTVELGGAQGRVGTLVGQGLFEFGDRDGDAETARLQHPLGVCAAFGAVWVADSYNNMVRRIDITSGEVSAFAGNGAHGLEDGVGPGARLWEPGNIRAGWNWLYVADTNNHAVRVLDPNSGTITTLPVEE